MSLIRKHGAVLQAWACLALVYMYICCFIVEGRGMSKTVYLRSGSER